MNKKGLKTAEKKVSTSFWVLKHPKAGWNTQHLVIRVVCKKCKKIETFYFESQSLGCVDWRRNTWTRQKTQIQIDWNKAGPSNNIQKISHIIQTSLSHRYDFNILCKKLFTLNVSCRTEMEQKMFYKILHRCRAQIFFSRRSGKHCMTLKIQWCTDMQHLLFFSLITTYSVQLHRGSE